MPRKKRPLGWEWTSEDEPLTLPEIKYILQRKQLKEDDECNDIDLRDKTREMLSSLGCVESVVIAFRGCPKAVINRESRKLSEDK